MRKVLTFVVPLCLGLLASAEAQDFGKNWADRVLRQVKVQEDAGPYSTKSVDLKLSAGEQIFWDNNIFLENDNEDSDTVFVTFVEGAGSYQYKELDLAANVMVNYKNYVQESDESDDEERFYGRARYIGSKFEAGLGQILRIESDPVDVVYVQRAERLVSDTLPSLSVYLTKLVAIEGEGSVQIVDFKSSNFDNLDNNNYRASVTGVYEAWSGIAALAQAGWMLIEYDKSDVTPDVDGVFGRLGVRGELARGINFDVRAGVANAESDDFDSGVEGDELTTADVQSSVIYIPNDKLSATLEYGRRIGFSGGGQAFQAVNSITSLVGYDVTDKLKAKGRVQYDYSHGSSGVNRDYWSVSGGAEYAVIRNVLADGGITYRAGEVKDVDDTDFSDVILSIGAVVTF